jgi:hypothetical protein
VSGLSFGGPVLFAHVGGALWFFNQLVLKKISLKTTVGIKQKAKHEYHRRHKITI